MQNEKIFRTILVWLPSVVITLFFVPNALDKIINPNQAGKIITNSYLLFSVGVFLLISVGMFLYNKTAHIGAACLSIYMTIIVVIHMYKGKPHEVAILLVIATVFASYIRQPKMFWKLE